MPKHFPELIRRVGRRIAAQAATPQKLSACQSPPCARARRVTQPGLVLLRCKVLLCTHDNEHFCRSSDQNETAGSFAATSMSASRAFASPRTFPHWSATLQIAAPRISSIPDRMDSTCGEGAGVTHRDQHCNYWDVLCCYLAAFLFGSSISTGLRESTGKLQHEQYRADP